MASPIPAISPSADSRSGKKDRPCDACRRRKSRCVLNDGQSTCVLCQFHSQPCTYLQEPTTRKRKAVDANLDNQKDSPEVNGRPRFTSQSSVSNTLVEEYDDLDGPSLLKKTLGLRSRHHSHFIGATSSLEPSLLGELPMGNEEIPLSDGLLRRVSKGYAYTLMPDKGTMNYDNEVDNLDEIESVVAPHGKALVALYFRIVHPSWPILHKDVFLEKYARSYREFSSPLLAAVYLLSLHYWTYDDSLARFTKPDVEALSRLAKRTLADTIHRPKLSTVQAGLLLLQYTEVDPAELTPQLVNVGYGLGLHLNTSEWSIPDWEKGLRNRLGWSLYLQDKFSCLGTGRPPLMASANWALHPLTSHDFPEREEDEREGSSEVEQGRVLFSQMVLLTEILADMFESLFTLRVTNEIAIAGADGLGIVLEKAKPIQLRLKEWFARLPECLSMESTSILKLSSVGHLRLAYLATEISLHRRIILALSQSTPTRLKEICRSAARERFLSAISFVESLKPQHLQSFWFFASAEHFALIATFGCLMYGTSGTVAEQDFYRNKLREYRWMLKIHSQNGVRFMRPAMAVLDTNLMFLTISGKTTTPPSADVPRVAESGSKQQLLNNDGSLPQRQLALSPDEMSNYSYEDFQYTTANPTPGSFEHDMLAFAFTPSAAFNFDPADHGPWHA